MELNSNSLKTFSSVTRWELINAISKLHVINDRFSQLRMSVNNVEIRCCTQLTKGGQNSCQCSVCDFKRDLTKITKRQVIDND